MKTDETLYLMGWIMQLQSCHQSRGSLTSHGESGYQSPAGCPGESGGRQAWGTLPTLQWELSLEDES